VPTESICYKGIRFKSHNSSVRAGLNPIDWMEMMKGDGIVLHKIVLNREQAELCVVAEGLFRPTEEEIAEFRERLHVPLVGSQRRYDCENYEKSFVRLLEYSRWYNLPEVLIPFSVKADIVSCAGVFIWFWRLKTWFAHKKMRKSRNQ